MKPMAMAESKRVELNAAAALTVDVQVACSDTGIPHDDDITAWVELAVAASGRLPGQDAELVVRVVDTDEIRVLNESYRRQDQPTNVLSFPAGAVPGLPDDAVRMLGDVVVCASVVRAEAEEQGKALADHWGHMLVHGTLHLLGYDHEADSDAAEMERLEAQILARRGLADPYTS